MLDIDRVKRKRESNKYIPHFYVELHLQLVLQNEQVTFGSLKVSL